jgi:hypothetical protein
MILLDSEHKIDLEMILNGILTTLRRCSDKDVSSYISGRVFSI